MADAETLSADPRTKPGSRRLLVDALIVVATLSLATALFFHRGGPLAVGDRIEASFSVIAPDAEGSECAADLGLEEYRCRFDSSFQRNPDRTRREVVPLNGDHGLMLLDGVFDHEDVRDRIKREPPGLRRQQYKRFTIYCTLRLLHHVQNVRARWTRGGWQNGNDTWLAATEDCTVGED